LLCQKSMDTGIVRNHAQFTGRGLRAWGHAITALPLLVLATLLSPVYGPSPLGALPSLAVMPLRPLGGVSREEADAVGNLLEIALVNSAAFQIVERKEIAEVLVAQEYSTEEFVEESLAVQVGRLLCAGQILLGTVSTIGAKYYLTARIIDVATGTTLRADKEEGDTIAAIAARTEALAHRLAAQSPATDVPGSSGPPAAGAPRPSVPVRSRSPEEQRDALRSEARRLEEALEAATLRARRLKRAGLACFGAGGGFALASGVTLARYLADREVSPNNPCGQLSASFAVLASVVAIVGTMIELERPDIGAIQQRIREVKTQTELLDSRIEEEEP
jgi:TolB-like protein